MAERVVERTESTPIWGRILVLIIVLVIAAGLVAVAYSPLVSGIFGKSKPVEPAPSSSQAVPGAPGPDNTVVDPPPMPAQSVPPAARYADPNAPGPDNNVTELPPPDHD